MFSKELEVSISQAYQEARSARHEFLTVEHLLLALLDNSSALSVVSACGADINGLEAELRKALQDTVPVLGDEDSRDTQPTIGFQRVLQRALYHVQSAGKQEVIGSNVLVAIFSEKDSYAIYLLNKFDVTRLDVVDYLSHGISPLPQSTEESGEETATETLEEGAEARSSALESFTSNLNDRAREGKIEQPVSNCQRILLSSKLSPRSLHPRHDYHHH